MLKSIRQSNFELLRLLSMFLIVVHHFAIHGVTELAVFRGYNVFSLQSLIIFGNTGVYLFIMVSAYFLIGKEFSLKRMYSTVFHVIGYGIIILGLLYPFYQQYFTWDLLKYIIPFFNSYWFIDNYLLMLLLAPIFNWVIKSLNKTQLTVLIIILFIVLLALSGVKGYGINYKLIRGCMLIWMYLVVGVLKQIKVNQWYLWCTGSLLIYLAYVYTVYLGHKGIYIGSIADLISFKSLFVIGFSITLFMGFKGLKIHNNLINQLSSATLGVYLIHEHHVVRRLLWGDWVLHSQNGNWVVNYFMAYAKGLMVFIICLGISYVINKLFNPIINKWMAQLNI